MRSGHGSAPIAPARGVGGIRAGMPWMIDVDAATLLRTTGTDGKSSTCGSKDLAARGCGRNQTGRRAWTSYRDGGDGACGARPSTSGMCAAQGAVPESPQHRAPDEAKSRLGLTLREANPWCRDAGTFRCSSIGRISRVPSGARQRPFFSAGSRSSLVGGAAVRRNLTRVVR